MTALLGEGFMLGLTTGSYCLAGCSPFLLHYLLADPHPGRGRRAIVFLRFSGGRYVAYLAYAALSALLGFSVQRYLTQTLVGSILLASGALLVVSTLRAYAGKAACLVLARKLPDRGFPWLTGFLLGLNLCPPMLAGFARLVSLGSLPGALVYFHAFFAGTTLFLAALPLLSTFLVSAYFRRLGNHLGLLFGIWFVIQGVLTIAR
jgi:sulfite exporter TauE/SafE